jgi:hypothetical protein
MSPVYGTTENNVPSAPGSAAAAPWECHLLALGNPLPEALRPALEALHNSLNHPSENTTRGDFTTARVPQSQVVALTEIILSLGSGEISHTGFRRDRRELLRQEMRARIQGDEIKDETLLELMQRGKLEGDAILDTYLNLMNEANLELARFVAQSSLATITQSDYLKAVAAIVFLKDPSGSLTIIPSGVFDFVLDLAKKANNSAGVEHFKTNLDFLAAQSLTQSFIVSQPLLSQIRNSLRAGSVIPTADPSFSLYDDNQTIGLPFESFHLLQRIDSPSILTSISG